MRRGHAGAAERPEELTLVSPRLADGLLRDADTRRRDADLRPARENQAIVSFVSVALTARTPSYAAG